MASSSKRRRVAAGTVGTNVISQLLHVGAVSTSGLAEILKRLEGSDLSQAPTIKALAAANEKEYMRMRQIERVVLSSGKEFDWEFLHPSVLLSTMVEQCSTFRTHIAAAMATKPPSHREPWSLVLAFDEYAPGFG